MDWTVWTAFAGACVIVLMIPGPTIMLVVSYALTHGRSSAMWTVAGVGLGDFTAMTASLLGLGAILSASAELFTLLKLVGACYLIWLGVKMWRAPVDAPITPAALENGAVDAASASGPDQPKGWKMLGHAYIVTALNPKGIVFFVAFLPQFLDPTKSYLSQVVVMEATFLVLAVLNALIYAVLAAKLHGAVQRPAVRRVVNRVGGSLLIGAGALTAGFRQTT